MMTFEVGQGVSGINPQGFHASVSPRIFQQNFADLFGVFMYYRLTYLLSRIFEALFQ